MIKRLNFPKIVSRSTLRPFLPLIGLIALNLLLAPLFIDDYGETWDDNSLYLYGEDTLDAYMRGLSNQELTNSNFGPFNLRYYGPVYYAAAEMVSQPMNLLPNDWNIVDRWHLVNFLGFQITLVFLYVLCRRIMSIPAAFASVLLFETQPLIWGHAIINPKDMPFLMLFLGSIVTGLAMVDAVVKAHRQRGEAAPPPNLRALLKESSSFIGEDWLALPAKKKAGLVGVITLLIVGVGVLYLGAGSIQDLLAALTRSAYHAQPSSLLGQLFQQIAPNAAQISLDSYLQKSSAVFLRLRSFALLLLPLGITALLALGLERTRTWGRRSLVSPLLDWLNAYLPPATLLAGVVLGACTAVRILGPAAGGLVVLYFVWKARLKSLPAITVYGLVAGLVAYWGWPYLWEAPFSRFWEVLQLMSDFPGVGSVLFAGQFISPLELPPQYLITLIGLQLTLPVIALSLLGLVLMGLKFRQATLDRAFVLLLAVWFMLPVAVFTLSPPRLYDNFRQLLFLLPPVFLFAGVALDEILSWINHRTRGLALAALLILPGVIWIFQLHPYEYVFYNALAGGVGNAYSRYEMDYWVTSFQETAHYLNAEAPENAEVIVFGPEHIVKRAARDDLVFAQDILNQGGQVMPDYAVMTTRHNWHLRNYPDAPVVFEVERLGAIFAVVKYVGDEN